MCIDDRQRAFETLGDERYVFAESALGIVGLGDTHDQEVVTFARFARDRLRAERLLPPGNDIDIARLLIVWMRFERRRRLGRGLDLMVGTFAVRRLGRASFFRRFLSFG